MQAAAEGAVGVAAAPLAAAGVAASLGSPWTADEHLAFLQGLTALGKGRWKEISRTFVITYVFFLWKCFASDHDVFFRSSIFLLFFETKKKKRAAARRRRSPRTPRSISSGWPVSKELLPRVGGAQGLLPWSTRCVFFRAFIFFDPFIFCPDVDA